MKLCSNCEQFGKEQGMVGPNQMAMIPICKNPDFVNPVDGGFLPPGIVRKERDMCGLPGKGWIKKTTTDETPPTPPERPRILTSV